MALLFRQLRLVRQLLVLLRGRMRRCLWLSLRVILAGRLLQVISIPLMVEQRLERVLRERLLRRW
jgi:hypothetical protein